MSSSTKLQHIAFIMDGNGRWAKSKGLKRIKGHEEGAKTIRSITEYCAKHPTIKSTTFFAFSTENWKRPKYEVEFLMQLLQKHLKNELATLQKNGVRFKAIGDLSAFSSSVRKIIEHTEQETADNKRLTQLLALNYGGRLEIVQAINRLLKQEPKEITRQMISNELETPYSELDLLVRTSGEMRISNFLLWQAAYAELSFTDTYWPDFSTHELEQIIEDFMCRERRFGGVGS